MAAILIGFGYGLSAFLQAVFLQDVDANLERFARQVEHSLPVRERNQRWEVLADSSRYFQTANDEAFEVQWFNPEQNLLRSTLESEVFASPPGSEQRYETVYSQPRYRQLTVPWYYEGQLLGYVRVLQSLNSSDAVLGQLAWSLGLGIPITIVVIGLGGWLLSGMAIEPIRASYLQLQQFTADASHELRTPIAAIQTNAQVLLADEATTPEDYRRGLEAIERLSRRLSSLVGDLLFLVRNEAPRPDTVRTSVNLGALLVELIEEQQPVARQAGIDLRLTCEHNGLVVGAVDQLARLFLNLVSNALCYTPQEGRITLSLTREGRSLRVDVVDTGIGIAPEEQRRVFERFYRVEKARSRRKGGVGLGLAIARTIAHNHGGDITLTSQPNQGSTFTVRLPLRSEAGVPVADELGAKDYLV